MDEKEVNVQEFNGEEYFLYDTLTTLDGTYSIFVSLVDQKSIIVAQEKVENKETIYEALEEENKDKIIALYQEKRNS